MRMVQWPSYHQPALDAVRLDSRFVDLLEPLIGRNLKQIINQIHWKAPGSLGDFAWHQDSRFRRPASAYRNLATSYVQTGLAIDPHTAESGCMRSSRAAICAATSIWTVRSEVLGNAMTDDAAGAGRAVGLRRGPARARTRAISLCGAPIWSTDRAPIRSDHKRRLYINGYVRAEDCDRGEWAFRDGRPVPFGPSPRWCITRSCTNGRARIMSTGSK